MHTIAFLATVVNIAAQGQVVHPVNIVLTEPDVRRHCAQLNIDADDAQLVWENYAQQGELLNEADFKVLTFYNYHIDQLRFRAFGASVYKNSPYELPIPLRGQLYGRKWNQLRWDGLKEINRAYFDLLQGLGDPSQTRSPSSASTIAIV